MTTKRAKQSTERKTTRKDTRKTSCSIAPPANSKQGSCLPRSRFAWLAPTIIFITTAQGMEQHPARYALVDARDIIPSHIPIIGPGLYRENPLYPPGIQERRYHRDKSEVQKVRSNAQQFRPHIVINNNPDAVNGPPIVDKNLVVLGGNSRTMTQQLLYMQGDGHLIKDALLYICGKRCYGITKRHVEKIEQPILVRVIDYAVTIDDLETARTLVRRYNESFTQDLDYSAQITAMSTGISPDHWMVIAYQLAQDMGDDGIGSFLLTPKSIRFLQTLQSAGVITARNHSKLLQAVGPRAGLLNRQGRQLVKELLLGAIIKDPELIDAAQDSLLTALESIAPFAIMSRAGGKRWDISRHIPPVIDALNAALSTGADLSEVFNQMSLFGGGFRWISCVRRDQDAGAVANFPRPLSVSAESLATCPSIPQLCGGCRTTERATGRFCRNEIRNNRSDGTRFRSPAIQQIPDRVGGIVCYDICT